MRRAIVATVGTVAALVAILDYKSHGGTTTVQVAVPTSPVSSSPVSSSGASGATGTTGTTVAAPSASTGSSTTVPATTTPTSSADKTSYTGTEIQYQYGEIKVTIAEVDGKITEITVPVNTADDPQSESINSQAVPILTKEALAAQGVHFDVVSGATYTSNAFAQALQSALDKSGK